MADLATNADLSLQDANEASRRILAVGEVLWDIFDGSQRLGGAPLSFAAHAKHLGCEPRLISAVGADELGRCAIAKIATLGLDTSLIQRTWGVKTGTAQVRIGPGERTRFVISRPAAYDSVTLSEEHLKSLQEWSPGWLYYGTLFAARTEGKAVLDLLLEALPSTHKFYDLNLRPGYDSQELVVSLLARADVVKLNEDELSALHEFAGLPRSREAFCREGAKGFGWRAVAVTLGSRGCAMLAGDEYTESSGHAVDVADPVGAGDAFAAAFLHGLSSGWPVAKIAQFANRVGALVASRPGAIPEWTMEEVLSL